MNKDMDRNVLFSMLITTSSASSIALSPISGTIISFDLFCIAPFPIAAAHEPFR